MNKNGEIEQKPNFDKERAKDMVGKRILVGLTYYNNDGVFIEQKQMHGKIVSANERKGFAIELEGSRKGETYWLPPDLRGFQDAKPGEYRERSTGEIIIDPDMIGTWDIFKAPPETKTGK